MSKDIDDLLSYIGKIPEEEVNKCNIVQEDLFIREANMDRSTRLCENTENIIECTCKIEVPKTDNLIRCPHCGESYYMENYSICTAMYCPPIYKDGVNINPDRNTTTTYCTCMNCGKDFSFNN